jgi:hypothetical protein
VTADGQLPFALPVTLADRIKAWWDRKLDSDSVREFVPHYNAAWLAWAFLATFLLPAVPTVSEAMGVPAYWVWTWLAIPANALPMIGLKMRHGGSAIQDMSTRLLRQDWFGLYFQAAGHALACFLMVMFEISAVITVVTYDGPNVYAGLTVFAAFMLWPWTEGTLLLCAQCLRKVNRGKQIELQGYAQ